MFAAIATLHDAARDDQWLRRLIEPKWLQERALELPTGLSYEQWAAIGNTLRAMERNALWWLGDWWNYGEREYGAMASQEAKEAVEDATGYDWQTVNDAGWVNRRFEFSRRCENLSWSHHREVAALEPQEADHWLYRAEGEGWSQKELRRRLAALAARKPNMRPRRHPAGPKSASGS